MGDPEECVKVDIGYSGADQRHPDDCGKPQERQRGAVGDGETSAGLAGPEERESVGKGKSEKERKERGGERRSEADGASCLQSVSRLQVGEVWTLPTLPSSPETTLCPSPMHPTRVGSPNCLLHLWPRWVVR